MRELTVFETRETAGGLIPLLVVGIAASVAGRYLYNPVAAKKEGGEDGKDKSQG